jgi:hypothetical protein
MHAKTLVLVFLAPCFWTTSSSFPIPSSRSSNNDNEHFIKWQKVADIVSIESPWLKIKGERIQDDQGKLLDYWRVEKEDSVVIVTQHRGMLVFPKPTYRPGLDEVTLDFPGGRVPAQTSSLSSRMDIAKKILERKLGIQDIDLEELRPCNSQNGWPVNSSFSNQKLFGFVAIIKDSVELNPNYLHTRQYSTTSRDDMEQLLESDLTCLQCRSVLLEWLRL